MQKGKNSTALAEMADYVESIRNSSELEKKLAKELLIGREAFDIIEMLGLGGGE